MKVGMKSQSSGSTFLCWLEKFRNNSKKPLESKNSTANSTKIEADNQIQRNVHSKPAGEAITFSEALDKTGYGKFNYFVIIVTGVVLAHVLLETTAAAFFMPVAECDLQLTNPRKGLLSAISYIGIIVSSHLWGFLADTKGRKKVIKPTLIVGFVATVASSFATNFWTMLTLRFINGIFVSGASATVYAYVSEFHTDRTRSKAMMIASFIFALGAMFMPFLSFAVINREWRLPIPLLGITYKPWRLFTIVCGLPGFLCGLAMYFLPESPKFLLSMNRQEEAKAVLQQMYGMNGGCGQLELPNILPEDDNVVSENADKRSNTLYGFLMTMWDQTVPLFNAKHLRSTLIVCITQFWLFFITNGLYMWFPYIINAMGEFMRNNPGGNERMCQIVYDKHDTLQQTESNVNFSNCPDKLENTTYMYSFLMEILYSLTFATLSFIVNRMGKLTILFIIIVFGTSCGIVAVLLPYTSVAAIFYVILFLTGAGVNVLSAITVELYPTQLRAMAMCVSLMLGRIGSVVGTNFAGALLSDYCELTFYISCFAMMSCALLILFLPRNTTTTRTNNAQGEIE